MVIEIREGWDKLLLLSYSEEVKREHKFWQENVCKSNSRRLASYSPSSFIIYSDASNVACGAYSVEIQNIFFLTKCGMYMRKVRAPHGEK